MSRPSRQLHPQSGFSAASTMNKDTFSLYGANNVSLSCNAVRPHGLFSGTAGGSNGEQEGTGSNDNYSEEGNIELPNDPTVPQTPTVEG